MKRKNSFLVITVCLCLLACKENTIKEPDLKSMNEGTLMSHNFFFSLPYNETTNGAAVISVVIKGKPYRFMIDTGAPLSISKSLQKKLGFPVLQEMQLRDANGDTTDVKIVRAKNLSIGPVEVTDVPALILDLESPLFACDKLDGLVGSNLLRLLMIQFNKPEKKIYFSDHIDSFHLGNSNASLNMQLNDVQSDPSVAVRLNGNVIDTVLYDTGDPNLYNLSKTKFNRFNEAGSFSHAIVHTGCGVGSQGLIAANLDSLPSLLVSVDSFGISQSFIHNVRAMQQYDNRSRMGRGLWDYGVVTMDYLNKKFYFSPFNDNLKFHAKPDFGFEYQERNGKLLVTVVWNNTEAFRCGMKPGNEILQFGSFLPASVSKCNWGFYTQREVQKKSIAIRFRTEKGEIKQCLVNEIFPTKSE